MKSITVTDSSQLGNATIWLSSMLDKGLPGGPVVVSVGREDRTLDQNDRFHPMIRDIARHIKNPVLGTNELQWRYFLIAQWQGQVMVQSLDGQQLIVVPKKGTSQMNKAEGSSFIEYLYSVGAEYGVAWSEPSLQAFEQYRESK